MASFQLTPENLLKVTKYVSMKQPPKVTTQRPAAGTPVLEGMTIEVQAVSDSDIPYYVLDANAPFVLKNIPIADLHNVIATDDMLKTAVATGTISDPAAASAKINSALLAAGFTGTLSASDATAFVKSFNALGIGGT